MKSLNNSESLSLMKELKVNSIDAIITDPPYNISRDNNFATMGRAGIDFGEWDKDFNLTSWIKVAEPLLLDFINNFKGVYLYPRVIRRKFHIDMVKVYEVLNVLVKYNALNLAFEIYCNECDKFQNDVYDSLNDIPNNIACEYCGKDINFNKDIIVVYKVCKNE